jgi:hypothetical protein
MTVHQNAAIMSLVSDAGDGHPSCGYDAAKVKCAECDGWEGVACPHGCGVHLMSVQAEKDAEFMARMRAEDAERKERRAARERF